MTSTLKRECSLATASSTCSWPAPESSISWVCGSRLDRSPRSSSIIRCSASEIFSSSPFDLGSMANEIAGGRMSIQPSFNHALLGAHGIAALRYA